MPPSGWQQRGHGASVMLVPVALWVLRPCWLQPHGPYFMPTRLAVLAFHSTPHLYFMTARIWENSVFASFHSSCLFFCLRIV